MGPMSRNLGQVLAANIPIGFRGGDVELCLTWRPPTVGVLSWVLEDKAQVNVAPP